jgi:putative phosphoesterase
MRIAALYDIHGNLPALEAALDDVRAESVDAVVVGGDVIPGPMPRETLECLMALDVPVHYICGNCEVALLQQMAGLDPLRVPAPYRDLFRWTATEVAAYRSGLAAWPRTTTLDVDRIGRVLFCHGTPRDEDECFTRRTPDARLLQVMAGVQTAMVVCGHTHMQFDRTAGSLRVVNAGSIGMPFGEPGAYWLLLGPGVELRRTQYDLQAAVARIRRTASPMADEFAAHSVLEPPTEAAMLDVFARADVAST